MAILFFLNKYFYTGLILSKRIHVPGEKITSDIVIKSTKFGTMKKTYMEVLLIEIVLKK
jgi:hypothetical protein